jgi:MFS family permease
MNQEKVRKLSTLLSLYIAQSIPMSFFSTVVPVIMRQEHYSLQSIGLLQLIKLPWILKFLWAPLVDNTSKSTKDYKRWIIYSEIFYAVVIIATGFFSLEADFKLILFFMVLAFFGSATQDIATDAFAILSLKKDERGIGNSIQSFGSFIGTLIGSGFMLIIYHYFGWQYLLMALGVFVMLATAPVCTYKKLEEKKPDTKKVTMKDIKYFFTQKNIGKRIIVLAFFYSGIIGILAMLKPFLVDLGYSVKEIGFMSGIYGTGVGAISTFAASYLIKRKKIIGSAFTLNVLMIITAIYFLSLSYTIPSLGALYFGITLLWGCYGMATVVVYTSSMNIVREGREGTDFTIQIVITHLSSMIIAILSGKIGHVFGYQGLFSFEIAMGFISLILLIITTKTIKNK